MAKPNDSDPATRDAGESREAMVMDALDEAMQLVRYSTRQGIPVERQIVKDLIIDSKNLTDANRTTDQEATFWENYGRLASAVHPVTIDSIRDCTKAGGKDPKSKKCARIYTFSTLATLALLIVLQIYWIVGNNHTVDIESTQVELIKSEAEVNTLNQRLAIMKTTIRLAEENLALEEKPTDQNNFKVQETRGRSQSSKPNHGGCQL